MYWEITVWDSTKMLKKFMVPAGRITDGKLEELLRVLTAKYALRDEEIIPCFQKKKTKGHSVLLEVLRSYKPITYSCGVNPYSHARIVKVPLTKSPSNPALQRTRRNNAPRR